LETEYVNVPKVFQRMEMALVDMLKVHLWPYYAPSYSTIENIDFESGTYKTITEMTFMQETPSFDLKIVMPTQKVFFSNVRIAYPFNLFFPLTAVKNNVKLGISKVLSGSVLPSKSCMIYKDHLIQFNGKSMNIPNNDASMLIASDCSYYHRFAVKAQHVQEGIWNTDIILKKNLIQVRPVISGIRTAPEVLINGQPIPILAGHTIMAKDINGHNFIATVEMTPDLAVIVQAPSFLLDQVVTDGEKILVHPSAELKNKLCGACGNFQKPILTETIPGQCVYSKPELEIASWTIATGSSTSVSPSVLSLLKKETATCSKVTVQPTKVAKAYKASTGECTVLKRLLWPGRFDYRPLCISKYPVTECGPSCKPQDACDKRECWPDITEKTVEFVCVSPSSAAEVERWNKRGVSWSNLFLSWLQNKKPTFTAKVRMPTGCVHSLVTRGI